jgi:uncharacterized protein YciI
MYFVVIREQGQGWESGRELREQPGWDEHASYMDRLTEEGFVLIAGPVSDGGPVHRALQIVNAEDETDIAARLEEDPWTPMGVLSTAAVYRWTILLGDPPALRD